VAADSAIIANIALRMMLLLFTKQETASPLL
jgi:hypothetical protein